MSKLVPRPGDRPTPRQALSALSLELRLGDHAVSDRQVNLVNSTYGRELGDFADAAAEAIEEGGDVYGGLGDLIGRLRAGRAQVEDLRALKDKVLLMGRQITVAWNAARVALAADVTTTCQAVDAIQLYPGVDQAGKRQAEMAAGRLRGLRKGRRAGARAAYVATRARNEEHALRMEDGERQTAELRAELAEAELHHRFLTHGNLRPEDFAPAAPAVPTAPQALPAPRRSRRRR